MRYRYLDDFWRSILVFRYFAFFLTVLRYWVPPNVPLLKSKLLCAAQGGEIFVHLTGMICLWAGNLMANFGKMSIPTPCPASSYPPHQVKREMWSLFNFLGGGNIWPQMGMFVSGSGQFEFEFWLIHVNFALTSFLIHINWRKKRI